MKTKKGFYTISLDTDNAKKKDQLKHSLKFVSFIIPIIFVPVLGLSLLAISLLVSDPQNIYARNIEKVNPKLYALFSSKPKVLGTSSIDFTTDNPRIAIIKQFFEYHKAPLAKYAEEIVKEADNYKIDWRLVPAIGMCESNGGKNIPEDSFNAWGWAASEKDLAEKSGNYNNNSWEYGIARVSRGLANGYYHLIDPSDGIDFDEIWTIMKKYTPPSVAKGGPWAKCVWQYYQELTSFQTPSK